MLSPPGFTDGIRILAWNVEFAFCQTCISLKCKFLFLVSSIHRTFTSSLVTYLCDLSHTVARQQYSFWRVVAFPLQPWYSPDGDVTNTNICHCKRDLYFLRHYFGLPWDLLEYYTPWCDLVDQLLLGRGTNVVELPPFVHYLPNSGIFTLVSINNCFWKGFRNFICLSRAVISLCCEDWTWIRNTHNYVL